jgi:hypothetical protein
MTRVPADLQGVGFTEALPGRAHGGRDLGEPAPGGGSVTQLAEVRHLLAAELAATHHAMGT